MGQLTANLNALAATMERGLASEEHLQRSEGERLRGERAVRFDSPSCHGKGGPLQVSSQVTSSWVANQQQQRSPIKHHERYSLERPKVSRHRISENTQWDSKVHRIME